MPGWLERNLAWLRLCCVLAMPLALPDAVLPVIVSPAAAAEATAGKCAAATGQDYSGKDLTNHNFASLPPGSLRSANFTGAKLSGAAFDGQDLTGAVFENADLGPAKGPVSFSQATLANTCFAGANLDQTDFSYAVITCADFSSTSLLNASFGPQQDIRAGDNCRTRFVGATLDVRLIGDNFSGNSNWSRSDFTNATFHNALPALFNLTGKDITGAILVGTALIGIDMSGANLTNVDFSSADISKANLTGATLNGAKLVQTKASSATFACIQAYGNAGAQKRPDGSACPQPPQSTAQNVYADFSLATLKNADFTAATLDHAAFPGANLNRAVLTGASLEQANLESSEVTGHGKVNAAVVQYSDFSSANLKSAHLAGVDFSGGTLTKAIFDSTTLDNTKFTNATMPSSSFRKATLQSVDFGSAILQSVDFSGATLQTSPTGGGSNLNFQCAQLGGATFSDSLVRSANFDNAVMPAAAQCCSSDKSGVWCGMIDATQATYPGVTFPLLNNVAVTCPNGDVAACSPAQWQLSPDWTTTGCSPEAASQTLWSKPNCGGTPGDQVKFQDANLKRCILDSLPGQTEVLTATAQQMRQVSCPGRGITDIGGLEAFTFLERLDLSGNALTVFTLSFGSGAKSRLTSLDVSGNHLITLDLTRHPSLLMLRASRNQLASIALNANTSLLVLEAADNGLVSFDLAIQIGLTYADLSHNKLTSVLNGFSTDLGQSTALTYLDLSNNALSTIGGIAGIAAQRSGSGGALQSLSLGCNASFDCSSLAVSDGSSYPAIASSQCARYDAASRTWTTLAKPDCTP